jgi:hypothetical protein
MSSADAHNFRRTVNRARRYFDPLPPCELNPEPDEKRNLVNVTGITGVLASEFRATRHGINGPLDAHRAAAWAVENLDALAAHEAGEAHAAIVKAAKADLAAAADRGTAVHELVEGELLGRPPLMLDPAAEPYRRSVEDLLGWLDAEVLLVEAVAFAPDGGYAGTLDAALHSRRLGRTLLVDWKSRGAESSHGCYEKEVAQLGLLAACNYVVVDDAGQAVRRRLPELDGVAVASLRPDSWELYEVDLDGALDAGRLTLAAWQAVDGAKRVARRAKAKPITAAGAHEAALAEATELITEAFPGTVVDEAETARRLAERQERVLDLLRVERDRDRSAFAAQWQSALGAVPGPQSSTTWTHDQLDAIERAYGLSFTDAPLPPAAVLPLPERVEPTPLEDHGGRADPAAVAELVERLNSAPEGVLAWQRLWRAEGDAAGHAWRMGRGPHISARAFDASLTGWWLAKLVEQADDPETGLDDARRVLASVLGDAAEMPAITIGACLGALDREQAAMAVTLAQAAYEGEVRMTSTGLFEVAA